MNEDLKNIGIGVVVGTVVNLIPEVGTKVMDLLKFDQLKSLNFTVIPLFIGFLFFLGGRLRQKSRKHVTLGLPSMHEPPFVYEEMQFEKFGVKWIVLIGSSGREKPYAYAKGPYCPICGYELDRKERSQFLGWFEKPVWKCADCRKTYDRPEDDLYQEDEVVEKLAMREWRNKNP